MEAVRTIVEGTAARPGTINRDLRGDVETIVLKAISKEPDRRYPSAAELAADISRFLNHEPIVARPPTTFYQLTRFAQRNKALAAGILIVACWTGSCVAVYTSDCSVYSNGKGRPSANTGSANGTAGARQRFSFL